MKKIILSASLLVFFFSCTKTEVRIENADSSEVVVKIIDNKAENPSDTEVSFTVAANTVSEYKELDWENYSSVNLNANAGHESGTVSLAKGEKNTVTVYQDGTEPDSKID